MVSFTHTSAATRKRGCRILVLATTYSGRPAAVDAVARTFAWRYRTMKRLCNMYSLDSEYTNIPKLPTSSIYGNILPQMLKFCAEGSVDFKSFDTGLHNLNTTPFE